MIVEIPVPTSAYSTTTIDLEGQTYRLNYRYNSREDRWYMDIAEIDGTPMAQSLKVAPYMSLSKKFKAQGAPPGSLIPLSRKITESAPGRDEFGDATRLFYIDSADIEAGVFTTPTVSMSTSNVSEITPVPLLAYVDTDGVTLVMTFSGPLRSPTSLPGTGFVVNVNASPATFSGAAISGNKITATLTTPVTNTDTVTVSYTKGTGDIESTDYIRMSSYTNHAVTVLA